LADGGDEDEEYDDYLCIPTDEEERAQRRGLLQRHFGNREGD